MIRLGYHLAASPPNAARNVARRVIAPATRRPPQTLATTQNGTGQIHAVAMPALKAGRLVASPNAAWQAGHTVRVITTTRYLPSPRDHRSPSNGSGRYHRIEDHGEMRGGSRRTQRARFTRFFRSAHPEKPRASEERTERTAGSGSP